MCSPPGNLKEHKTKKLCKTAINLNDIACSPNSRLLMMNLQYIGHRGKKNLRQQLDTRDCEVEAIKGATPVGALP